MFPSQLQFRELIVQTLAGFLFLLPITFIFLDFNPCLTIRVIDFLLANSDALGIWVIIPLLGFTISYVVGTCISNFTGIRVHSTDKLVNEQNTFVSTNSGILGETKRILLRIFLGVSTTDTLNIPQLIAYNPLLFNDMLPTQIEKIWNVDIERPISKQVVRNYFELCWSYINSHPATPTIIDIERQYIAMLFSARLTLVFILAAFISFIELINSIVSVVPSYSELHFIVWSTLIILFWILARLAANRIFFNAFHRTHLIYLAFVNYSILRQTEYFKH